MSAMKREAMSDTDESSCSDDSPVGTLMTDSAIAADTRAKKAYEDLRWRDCRRKQMSRDDDAAAALPQGEAEEQNVQAAALPQKPEVRAVQCQNIRPQEYEQAVSPEYDYSTVEPSASSGQTLSSAPRSGHLDQCPDSLTMPLDWSQVKYYDNPKTGKRCMDSKTSPIDIPHKGLAFRGYNVDKDRGTVAAFFVKDGLKGQKNCRMNRPAGGVNRVFFEELGRCSGRDEREQFKRANQHKYTEQSKRRGRADREI